MKISFNLSNQSLKTQTLFKIGTWGKIVLTRLRSGHTYLTHIFLLKGEDPLIWISYQWINTVKLFMLECKCFNQLRKNYFRKYMSFHDIFEHISHDSIISYVKGADLYRKIWFVCIYRIYICYPNVRVTLYSHERGFYFCV